MKRKPSGDRRPAQLFLCVNCGREENATAWTNPAELVNRQTCQDCTVWTKRAQERDDPNMVRICGILYMVQPEDAEGARGHAGRSFVIVFADGRRVQTSNLWYVGPVPHRFRPLLPDNARWGENP